MPIRLVALDMDGTTLDRRCKVSPRNRAAMARAAARGVLVVPTTGRVMDELRPLLPSLPGARYAITSNGATVSDLSSGQILYENPVPLEATLEILRAVAGLGPYIQVYHAGRAYGEARFMDRLADYGMEPETAGLIQDSVVPVESLEMFVRQNGKPLEKVFLAFVSPDGRAQAWQALKRLRGIALTSSWENNLEVGNVTASKADGLRALCARLQIAGGEVLAAGDNLNDIEMLRFAGVSVAVANALPPVREAADHITLENDRDGVALAIEKFVLGEGEEGC